MNIKKQLILFLLICLPVTWLLTAVPIEIAGENYNESAVVYVLSALASFVPAITAFICKIISKESIRTLNFFPQFAGNTKIYIFAIAAGTGISLWNTPLVMLLFMKNGADFQEEITICVILFYLLLGIAIGCVQFFVLMGEEIGWMGFLFPKFEELFGTGISIILTGIIRGIWHAGMLVNNGHFAKSLLELCISNIIFGALLVWLTKKSKSVIPAALCHAMNNIIPGIMNGLIIINETVYADNKFLIEGITFVPQIIFMGICWYLLKKEYRKKESY